MRDRFTAALFTVLIFAVGSVSAVVYWSVTDVNADPQEGDIQTEEVLSEEVQEVDVGASLLDTYVSLEYPAAGKDVEFDKMLVDAFNAGDLHAHDRIEASDNSFFVLVSLTSSPWPCSIGDMCFIGYGSGDFLESVWHIEDGLQGSPNAAYWRNGTFSLREYSQENGRLLISSDFGDARYAARRYHSLEEQKDVSELILFEEHNADRSTYKAQGAVFLTVERADCTLYKDAQDVSRQSCESMQLLNDGEVVYETGPVNDASIEVIEQSLIDDDPELSLYVNGIDAFVIYNPVTETLEIE